MEQLQIDINPCPNAAELTMVTFRGDLDTGSISEISACFNRILNEYTALVIADMSLVRSISSAALGELMGGRKSLVDNAGELYLSGLSLALKTKLTLMGANKIFSIFNDIRSAINAYKWHFEGKPESIALSFPPQLRFVPAVRQLASRIARQKGYNRRDSFRIETIVDEICNNAIEHGYTTADDLIEVALRIDSKKIEINVTNESDPSKLSNLKNFFEHNGQFKQPSADDTRGRGLALIKLLSNQLDIDITQNGTCVRATKLKEE
jgi:anti-anti-sigma factor